MSEAAGSEGPDAEQVMRTRRRKMLADPAIVFAALGIYASIALFFFPEQYFDHLLTARNVGFLIGLLSIVTFVSKYLGVFSDDSVGGARSLPQSQTTIDPALLREIRNYLVHAPRSSASVPAQINIDEEFKGQLLARITTESQSALASFVESEIFKKAADTRFKEAERVGLAESVSDMITTYQREMASWRKNANVNLLIGLVCAIAGIGVMWQTLITLNFELDAGASWKIADLYRILARLGLVIIIESVAFFFLKLYREDRTMIRYLRNEITNLESKCLALKSALSFGSPQDITKVLQSLLATERNFLVKKGERVMTDVTYENTDILLEKLLLRFPELLPKTRAGRGKTED